jgi:hypothetical protein
MTYDDVVRAARYAEMRDRGELVPCEAYGCHEEVLAFEEGAYLGGRHYCPKCAEDIASDTAGDQ